MIEMIIVNGGVGVSAAALEVATKLGLAYRGWYREGERVPVNFRIERLPDASWGAITEKAVAAGQGSLYITDGINASLRLETIKKVALRLNKPLLIIDLNREGGFSASQRMAVWITENQIKVLHVDGEGDSTPGRLANMLEATFFLAMMDAGIKAPLQTAVNGQRTYPQATIAESIDAVLDHFERTLSLKDRATIANMTVGELVSLHASLGEYINSHFDLFAADSGLLTDCRHRSGQQDLAPTDAAAVIIRALWERLRAIYRIRIVK